MADRIDEITRAARAFMATPEAACLSALQSFPDGGVISMQALKPVAEKHSLAEVDQLAAAVTFVLALGRNQENWDVVARDLEIGRAFSPEEIAAVREKVRPLAEKAALQIAKLLESAEEQGVFQGFGPLLDSVEAGLVVLSLPNGRGGTSVPMSRLLIRTTGPGRKASEFTVVFTPSQLASFFELIQSLNKQTIAAKGNGNDKSSESRSA